MAKVSTTEPNRRRAERPGPHTSTDNLIGTSGLRLEFPLPHISTDNLINTSGLRLERPGPPDYTDDLIDTSRLRLEIQPDVWGHTVRMETILIDHLFQPGSYSNNVRPNVTVNVKCALTINNILELDIVEQTFSIMGSLIVIWDDYRLSWDSNAWNGVNLLYLKLEDIWRPLLVHRNSAKGIDVFGDNSNHKSIPASVRESGDLYWLGPAYLVSFCQVDVSKFPFDTQTCQIEISSWMFGDETINVKHLYDKINLIALEENGEFEVMNTSTKYNEVPLNSLISLKVLVFEVELKRRSSYYLVNLISPILMLQALGIVIFLVPASSGEKLSFAFTLLLSLTVLMSIVSEKVPTTSLQVSTLSIYLLGGAIICGLEVIMTVVSLILKHRQDEGKPLTPGLRRFTYMLQNLKYGRKKKSDMDDEPETIDSSDDVGRVKDAVSDLAVK
ncbi:neuronal acetylcholine receptor subunit alpha-3-like [Mya arenaria]|uniref:neuronal acetylcholine receptor subunit alpha-3-like n=1 Tax=Mya arenaria TaxID=6604 RepID=UPI0022E0890F|nr:neuronal acetylcholine receptor subunit alpha-3-like [Mya arenaria]